MNKKVNPKIDLEYLIHTTIYEYDLDMNDIPKEEFRNYIYNIFQYMHRLDKIRFKFDKEFNRIFEGNKRVKEPEYDELDITNILQQIQHIDNIPKHEQRSPEWYQFRRENITASSVGYICDGKNNNYYSQIMSKCQDNTKQLSGAAILHGIKYEPVATAVYERRNRVKVLEYGCLPHKYIPHLAASPDGICDYSPHNPSYTGRMLEIKCPYSRQITGIIPEGYYKQIQVQLEVCDLMYCDFLECKISDFPSYEELMEYMDTITNQSFRPDEYGAVIEYALTKELNKTKYLYSEIGLPEKELESWIDDQIDEIDAEDPNFKLHKISYWVLDYSNIVLVKRDRVYFERLLPLIKEFWKDVEYFKKNRNKLDDYLNKTQHKSDYYMIDIMEQQSDKSNNDSECLFIDSDDDEQVIIKIDQKNKKKTKSSGKKTFKEYINDKKQDNMNKNDKKKNNKKKNDKFMNISNFGACMLD